MAWSIWVIIGSLLGGLSVALGAIGSHMLKDRLDDYYLGVFETAAKYQMYHALALLFVGLLSMKLDNWLMVTSGVCFILGTLLFSGSLYLIVFSENTVFGRVTPFGGVFLILGWVFLCSAAIRVSLA